MLYTDLLYLELIELHPPLLLNIVYMYKLDTDLLYLEPIELSKFIVLIKRTMYISNTLSDNRMNLNRIQLETFQSLKYIFQITIQ